MPEEINRIVTDQFADLLFTRPEDGDINLRRKGVPAERIYRVGNVMIDSLIQLLEAVKRFSKNGFPQRYALVTLSARSLQAATPKFLPRTRSGPTFLRRRFRQVRFRDHRFSGQAQAGE